MVPVKYVTPSSCPNVSSVSMYLICAVPKQQGTSRPVHYHVLLDEIGFSPDGLQNLIHSLSYV